MNKYKTEDFKRRFFLRVIIAENGCWEWTGYKNKDGYGRWTHQARGKFEDKAHRISWLIHKDEPIDCLDVLHTCDNPGCVNPAHLFLGTQVDNNKDMCVKKRNRWLSGFNHPSSTITFAECQKMRELYASGNFTQSQLAIQFDCDQTTISEIVRNKRRVTE